MPASQESLTSKLGPDHSSPMKILLVEDSALISDALVKILSDDSNLTVDGIATTQNRAIALLDQQQFDMLLVDIELAGGNGFEVIRHTQQADYPFKPPVLIMLTNHANSQYRRLAKELGVNYFFDKSMDFDLAIETIELEAKKFKKDTH
jgi:DNA-binding NarL/FixJ family response regulator